MATRKKLGPKSSKSAKSQSSRTVTKTATAKGQKKATTKRSRQKAKSPNSKPTQKKVSKRTVQTMSAPSGIVAKAKSVIRPVLAGAAAAAAVIATRHTSNSEEEAEASKGESIEAKDAEEVTDTAPKSNPKRIREGVVIDRRR